METPEAASKVVASLWEQLINAPSHLLLLVVLILVGFMIKKSPTPNWLIPWILVTLGVVGYPFLATPRHINPDFPNPGLILRLYGGIIGFGSIVAHMFLRKFAWYQRLEYAMVNAFRSEEQKEDTQRPKEEKP